MHRGASARGSAARRRRSAANSAPHCAGQRPSEAALLQRFERTGVAYRARVARYSIARAFVGDSTAGDAPREAIFGAAAAR
jgi:hypothetical protein